MVDINQHYDEYLCDFDIMTYCRYGEPAQQSVCRGYSAREEHYKRRLDDKICLWFKDDGGILICKNPHASADALDRFRDANCSGQQLQHQP